jgi:hypothetical protein
MKKRSKSLFGRLNNSVNLCASVKSVVKNQSIKNNKLCETNPISKKPKMKLNHSMTRDYENKSGLLTMAKQTQSNPTLSAVALAKADSQDKQSGVSQLCGGRSKKGGNMPGANKIGVVSPDFRSPYFSTGWTSPGRRGQNRQD